MSRVRGRETVAPACITILRKTSFLHAHSAMKLKRHGTGRLQISQSSLRRNQKKTRI
jgi:hypothetical protein